MSDKTTIYTLKNNRIEIDFIARGGQVISIRVPDKDGNIADVVLGYDTIEETLKGDGYFGALCGRYANRMAGGKFSINGESIQLDCNDGENHLHGGNKGFNVKKWNVYPIFLDEFMQSYKLTLVSEDGDQNYPGELKVSVIYGLTTDNQFVIRYEAETTKDTVINLTSHAYFNLKGAGFGLVKDQTLQLNASKYTPLGLDTIMVTGEIENVAGGAMDFTSTKPIGELLSQENDQVKLVEGVDHNFVIDNYDGSTKLVATLSDAESGRKMEVYTDQPGIQIYTGGHFDGTEKGKNGSVMQQFAGLAMETQNFPDAPNYDNFPDARLKPGELYQHECIYKFC